MSKLYLQVIDGKKVQENMEATLKGKIIFGDLAVELKLVHAIWIMSSHTQH